MIEQWMRKLRWWLIGKLISRDWQGVLIEGLPRENIHFDTSRLQFFRDLQHPSATRKLLFKSFNLELWTAEELSHPMDVALDRLRQRARHPYLVPRK